MKRGVLAVVLWVALRQVCLLAKMSFGNSVVAAVRKVLEESVATSSLYLHACCQANELPLSPGDFLACFEGVRSCSGENPLFHLH